MAELGVNIDHIATIRQARMGIEPEPLLAAAIAEQNGADQITIHLREDRRHIQDRDLKILKETIQTRLNLEMATTKEMIEIAREIKPDTVTLVPEKREELTTEGGLLLTKEHEKQIKELKDAGIEVSVFIEPDIEMIKFASQIGVNAVMECALLPVMV
jgi:pyridoxine 5-phosphate synthase